MLLLPWHADTPCRVMLAAAMLPAMLIRFSLPLYAADAAATLPML